MNARDAQIVDPVGRHLELEVQSSKKLASRAKSEECYATLNTEIHRGIKPRQRQRAVKHMQWDHCHDLICNITTTIGGLIQ
jgi:hypothetical protein